LAIAPFGTNICRQKCSDTEQSKASRNGLAFSWFRLL
jgi:hypothetical protein